MKTLFYGFILTFIVVKGDEPPCKNPSLSSVSGDSVKNKSPCSGDLIFDEDFDSFDLSRWQHEITLSGGGNWEFQYYANNRSNSYVENGTLHIRPTLLSDDFGEKFLWSGTLDLNAGTLADACTDPSFYGCVRAGTGLNFLNPVRSARIRTAESFSFRYGRVKFRARTPSGDWLWPAVWLMPRYSVYGKWPSSGEIDLLEARGNRNLTNTQGTNVGTQQISNTLHWGPYNEANRWSKTHFEYNDPKGFNTDFHDYEFIWTPSYITFNVDGEEIGSVTPPSGGFWELGGFDSATTDNPWKGASNMAPFDQEFYIIINLAVGGISFFDDSFVNQGGKPWSNKSPVAFRDFWRKKEQWLPTWNMTDDSTHLVLDYIKVFAL
ncbi:beta-1,3-glucan-binding protein-like [Sitophilus oryzae]|uniref:Beta-1,3-glucan-binding protein-like n=1 Tax=Sitophilus oryzae TaxID=7048 RepID=A0A6J2YD96_SITOR|nr:beta-1,3-glucan-binding protein-like [Sitophilus oryzae]